jgi:hypothetical protein
VSVNLVLDEADREWKELMMTSKSNTWGTQE